MPDRKWSELTPTTPQDSDIVALARGTANFSWSFTSLKSYLDGTFATDAALNAHIGAGGSAHSLVTVSAAGFAPTLSGDASEYLDGSGAYSTPPGGSGRIIMNEGVPLANQTLSAINIQGNALGVVENVPQDRYDIIGVNALINQPGGGVEVVIDQTGSDPVTTNVRTFTSTDLSVNITQNANTLDFSAPGGAGAGQINSAEIVGGGLAIANPVNNGILIPIFTFDPAVFENNADIIGVIGNTFADWQVADDHYTNTSIHFPVSSLPGAGLQQNGSQLDVGAGAGITALTDSIVVTNAPSVKGSLWTFQTGLSELPVGVGDGLPLVVASGASHGIQWGDMDGGFITTGTVLWDRIEPATRGAIIGRAIAGVGAVTQLFGTDLTPNPSPGAGDQLLSWTAGDGLRAIDVANLPSGATDVTSTSATVDNEIQLGDSPTRGIKGSGVVIANVPLLDGANFFTASNVFFNSGPSAFQVLSASAAASVSLAPGTGPGDGQRFSLQASAGLLSLAPLEDDNTPVAGASLELQHGGGMALGAPVGGIPATPGVANFEGLQIDGVAVTSGGDMTAPGVISVGNLYAAANASGTLTADTGIAETDVARRGQPNVFGAEQSIIYAGGASGVRLNIESTNDFATMEMQSGDGAPNNRRFGWVVSGADMLLLPLNDSGSAAGQAFQITHGAGGMFGNPAGGVGAVGVLNAQGLEINGVPVVAGSGSGDVTSAANTVDGQIQLGAIPTKGIKGLPKGQAGLPVVSGGTGPLDEPVFAQLMRRPGWRTRRSHSGRFRL